MFERYSVEVGDELWKALYDLANGKSIIEVCVEGDQTFAVFQDSDEKFYRVNFSYSESEGLIAEEPIDLTEYSLPEEAQFNTEEIEKFISEYEKIEDESDEKDPSKSEDKSEEEEEEEIEEEEKHEYSLEEIPEYVELTSKYNALETTYNELVETNKQLEEEINGLKEFKLRAERKDKEEMISKFYMLNDEDKKDVIDNIDTYSLDQIEAKLSILCVRNKVRFEDDEEQKDFNDMTFNLNDHDDDNDATTPAWVKAVLEVEKKMK